MTRAIRASAVAGFCGLTFVMAGAGAWAKSPPDIATPVLSSRIAAQYVHAHDLIDIGQKRKMNIFCMGQGDHTVIFDSGLSDWSSIWALVQPIVAVHARACTYDRAGMGYSDPSDQPRSPIAIVEDLHKLLRAAKVATPVVLVGHSLGGFNMKLYAVLYPKEVSGLVLVDPAEERIFARTRGALRAKFGPVLAAKLELQSMAGRSHAAAEYEACAAAARDHDLDPKSDFYKQCSDPVRAPLGPLIATERQKLQVKSAYQGAQASEFVNSVNVETRSDDAYAALFTAQTLGDKKLIVLTHSIVDPKDPLDAASLFAGDLAHRQTAALSTRGVNRVVPGTHHNIEIDRPQAVIDAIGEVLAR